MTRAAPEISVGVVIPAAGSGRRLGGTRKQFRLLNGKPLLVHTVAVFDRHPRVTAIAIAVSPDDISDVTELCREHGLEKIHAVVEGGASRQDSVAAALTALPTETQIILTHDAVRPFITGKEVSRLIEQVQTSGAAVIAAPVSDTLVRSESGSAGDTVPRENVYRMLTPQGFKSEILRKAHERAAETNVLFTDEVTLVRDAGYSVTLVDGSPINIKITTGSDWDLANWMWPAWEAR